MWQQVQIVPTVFAYVATSLVFGREGPFRPVLGLRLFPRPFHGNAATNQQSFPSLFPGVAHNGFPRG